MNLQKIMWTGLWMLLSQHQQVHQLLPLPNFVVVLTAAAKTIASNVVWRGGMIVLNNIKGGKKIFYHLLNLRCFQSYDLSQKHFSD